jgi:hypothetical protein
LANPDSFIDEVTEEVRRDRLFRAMRRYGWIAIVAVVAIVAAAVWREWDLAKRSAAAEAFGDAILDAVSIDDAAARQAALSAIETGGDARALRALVRAADLAADGDEAARTGVLDELAAVAADPGISSQWRDLATLKRILLAGPALDAATRRAALDPIAAPGNPLRPIAQELLAVAAIETGDIAAARALLEPLLADAEAPTGQRRRLIQILAALGPAGEGG